MEVDEEIKMGWVCTQQEGPHGCWAWQVGKLLFCMPSTEY